MMNMQTARREDLEAVVDLSKQRVWHAEFNGNSVYLRMNSINVEALWISMDISESIGDEDVTAGSGTVYEEHNAKLVAAKGKLTLAYNDTQAATDMAAQWSASHVIPIVYGPEGSTAGKPCDSRNWLITGIAGPSTDVSKTKAILEFDLVGTGAPTKNIHAGDTF